MDKKQEVINRIVSAHYPEESLTLDPVCLSRQSGLRLLLNRELDSLCDNEMDGSLPLHKEHICYETGHSMKRVFQVDKQFQSFGKNRCSRCGHEEKWNFPEDYDN